MRWGLGSAVREMFCLARVGEEKGEEKGEGCYVYATVDMMHEGIRFASLGKETMVLQPFAFLEDG